MTSHRTLDLLSRLELSGMVDENGLLSRAPLPYEKRMIPKLTDVVDGQLYWVPGGSKEAEKDGALDAFLKIRNDRDVAGFAERYGALELCKHGRPLDHLHEFPFASGCMQEVATYVGETPPKIPIYKESVERWLHYGNVARAILAIAASLHSGELGEQSDWDLIHAEPDLTIFKEGKSAEMMALWEETRPRNRVELTWLCWACEKWARIGDVKPALSYGEDIKEVRFELAGTGFGLIGLQLMLAITMGDGLTVCDGCKRPYLRQGRKAQEGRRNFCPDCGVRKANQIRKREQRHRKKMMKHEEAHLESQG